MSVHEQFADDLALHALGSLEGEQRTSLEKHLETCPACRLELDQLRGDMALMAMATTGPKPPQRARARLLEAVAKEPRVPKVVPSRTRFNWWAAFGWAAAMGMFLVVVQLRRENFGLRESVNRLAQLTGQQTIELANAKRAVDALTTSEAQVVTLVSAKGPPQPQGKAFYLKNRSGLVFVASNLPQLPPDKIYELWLIPPGAAPIPAGLFKPDARGNATVVNPPGLPAGVEAKMFAVTLESVSGPHDAPHGTGVMQGGA
jgi:anti-sigma-K factor RskA